MRDLNYQMLFFKSSAYSVGDKKTAFWISISGARLILGLVGGSMSSGREAGFYGDRRKIKNNIIFALGPQSLLLTPVVRNNSYIRFPSSIKDPNLHNARPLHVSIDGPTGLYSTIAINSSLSK
jgi:hypothetical protein